ncbi:hypothetical protein [Nocardia gipuzkoensis]
MLSLGVELTVEDVRLREACGVDRRLDQRLPNPSFAVLVVDRAEVRA